MQSLIGHANRDGRWEASPSRRQTTEPVHVDSGNIGGTATAVHSPPRQPARRVDARDNVSMALSDPWARCDQHQVLRERLKEDAQTTIERRREARHQSDRLAGPTAYKPAPGDAGDLPYAITYPAFTHELQQF